MHWEGAAAWETGSRTEPGVCQFHVDKINNHGVSMHSKAVRKKTPWLWLAAITAAMILVLPGCITVGPDYEKPKSDLPKEWDLPEDPAVKPNEAKMQTWWTVFDDPILDELITEAGKSNLDLRSAYARVKEARAQIGVARGELLPSVNADGSYSQSKTSEYDAVPGGPVIDNIQVGANATWEIDFWGRIRRSVESASASYEATEEDRVDVMITLYAQVAQSYFTLRSSQARLAAAYENIISQKQVLKLTRSRFRNGLATDLDVSQAETVLASTEAEVPPLKISQEQAYNSIDLLLGRQPGQTRDLLEPVKGIPVPPAEVAVGVPANILRQRPDIRKAERQLASATAQIGVAKADLYPSFSILGSIGYSAQTGGNLFRPGSDFYSWGPQFQWKIFEGGRIRAQIAVAGAQTEQALFSYQQTVLSALGEVKNTIVSYVQQRNRVSALDRTVKSSRRTLELAIRLYKDGLQDFQPVLDAQRTLFQYEDQLAAARGDAASYLVLLYKALGGGWNIEDDLKSRQEEHQNAFLDVIDKPETPKGDQN